MDFILPKIEPSDQSHPGSQHHLVIGHLSEPNDLETVEA